MRAAKIRKRVLAEASGSLRPHGLQPTRLSCSRDSPGKTTGVGCHVLLQGIVLSQGLNPSLLKLLHGQADSLPLSHLGTPRKSINITRCEAGKSVLIWILCLTERIKWFKVDITEGRLGYTMENLSFSPS